MIDFTPLKNAAAVFERCRIDMINERDKMGAVRAFEFSYELSWKMMQRVLKEAGLETGTPKDIFRASAKAGIIEDPELWFEFQKIRNITSHTYNQNTLEEVVAIFDEFSLALSKVIKNLEGRE